MKKRLCAITVFASLALSIGCGKPEPKDYVMGTDAPKIATVDSQALSKFVLGKWVLGSINRSPDLKSDIYEFKPDMTFEMKTKQHTLGGRWQVDGTTVRVQYTAIDGQPMKTALEQMRQQEERGTQSGILQGLLADWINGDLQKRTEIVVASDMQALTFKVAAGQLPGLDSLPPDMLEKLEKSGMSKESPVRLFRLSQK